MSPLTPLVWFAAVYALAGLAFVVYLRAQIRGAVGPERFVARPPSLARRFQVGSATLALSTLVWLDPSALVPAATAIVAAIAIGVLRPGFEDSAYGESGVQRGWFARRFENLDEWRLTGQHLRWSLYGDWQATEVPTPEHASLRERLHALIPERESRFQH